MLIFNNYTNSKSICFLYKESSVFILGSYIGITKVSELQLLHLNIDKYIYKFYSMSLFKFNFFNIFIHYTSFGYMNKLKMVGVAHKRFYNNSIAIYKLRYNHLICTSMPISILSFKKKRRRKYNTMFSLNKIINNSYFYVVLLYRVSNVYTKKGFFKSNHNIIFKKRKII